ncbi:MAG: TonB-dependent receptor, partial [Gammaproteobacteria bacterium]
MSEALRRLPGVTIRGRGGPAVPVLRGLAGGRTLVLLDDIRVVTERRAGPSATFLDPIVLGSIEVARGPGSVAYGSDAFGGVVHARTRDPIRGDRETTLWLTQSFGGQNATRAAATTSFDAFGGAVMAAIHARSEGEQKSGGGEPTPGSTYRDRGAVFVYRHEENWGGVRMVVGTNVARDVGVPSTTTPLTHYPTEGAHRITFDVDYLPHRISVLGGFSTHRLVTTRDVNTTDVS